MTNMYHKCNFLSPWEVMLLIKWDIREVTARKNAPQSKVQQSTTKRKKGMQKIDIRSNKKRPMFCSEGSSSEAEWRVPEYSFMESSVRHAPRAFYRAPCTSRRHHWNATNLWVIKYGARVELIRDVTGHCLGPEASLNSFISKFAQKSFP